jgi:hypothetical protein
MLLCSFVAEDLVRTKLSGGSRYGAVRADIAPRAHNEWD